MLCGCDFCSPVLPQCLEQKLRFLKVPFIGRNLLDFKGRPSSNAPLFPGWRNSQKNFRAPGTRNQTQDLCNASKILSTLQELAARKVTWLSSSSFTQSVPLPLWALQCDFHSAWYVWEMEWEGHLHDSSTSAFNACSSLMYHNLNCEGPYKSHKSIFSEVGK